MLGSGREGVNVDRFAALRLLLPGESRVAYAPRAPDRPAHPGLERFPFMRVHGDRSGSSLHRTF